MNKINQISIIGSGMMTGVGLNSPSSCAAMRCKIDNCVETQFVDSEGEWIVGSYVPLEKSLRGRAKLLHLIVSPIRECLDVITNPDANEIALLLCVSEKDRPGRTDGLDDLLMDEIQTELSMRFSKHSMVIPHGRVGGVIAIQKAMELIHQEGPRLCIVAGVDTYLTAGTLTAYETKSRILTDNNSNGFIPGEAGAAVILGPWNPKMKQTMTIHGIGFGNENAHIDSEDPLRADGLVKAIKEALSVAGWTMGKPDYRITDANGEEYVFKEAELTITRILRVRKEKFDIWHPAECVGEIGSAVVPCSLGFALTASRKKYAPGNRVLCHFGNDAGERGAIVMSYSERGD